MAEYIRREDAVKRLDPYRRFEIIQDAIDYIESLEPADVVQVRHAKWERYSGITIRCSRCEHVIHDWRYSECNFCPNCGAKMDGKE